MLTVDSSCAGAANGPPSLQQMHMVAANLQASAGDIDLGALNGVQFEQAGSTLTLGMYASVTGKLINFQIEVAIALPTSLQLPAPKMLAFREPSSRLIPLQIS